MVEAILFYGFMYTYECIHIMCLTVQVTERVHVSQGYSMGNCIVIEGNDGLIIVDTTENVVSAKKIKEAIRANLPDKPVVAVIYTHFHADHNTGTLVCLTTCSFSPKAHCLMHTTHTHSCNSPTLMPSYVLFSESNLWTKCITLK